MMKKNTIKVIVVILTAIIAVFIFSACQTEQETSSLTLLISGDIEDYAANVALNTIEKESFSYVKDNETLNYEGYRLSKVLEKVTVFSSDSWLLMTAADTVSARVDYLSANLIYIVEEDGKLNIKAPSHPPVAGIKGLAEITVIAKEAIGNGMKIVSEEETSVISYGNIRLRLFEQTAENYKLGNVAYKHMSAENITVASLTDSSKNYLYFDNKDIVLASEEGVLSWTNGRAAYIEEDIISEKLTGIVCGVDKILM
ncbi:MAG: hypothetical protein EOM87_08580, partial [Clostridia bacterium]|nr:hypothetical protein [Clostridia bacterium]